MNYWLFLLVIAFSWYSKPMGNFEESSEKIIKILKDNLELDKKSWSQETIDQLKAAVKSPNMTDLTLKGFQPLHYILDLYYSRGGEGLGRCITELIMLNHPLIDFNECDLQGGSIVHWLVDNSINDILDILERLPSVNFELVDAAGRTPLALAAELYQESRSRSDPRPRRLTFRRLLEKGASVDVNDKNICRELELVFKGFVNEKLFSVIAIGDTEGVKTFLASVADDYNPLVGCRGHNLKAFRLATVQGHFDIVKLLTSKDEWLKPEEAQRNLKEALEVAENMIVRIQKMLEQPKLTDETRKLYQERKENYQAIRSLLRATIILPLETMRMSDENRARFPCFQLPTELLYLIGFFLFGQEAYMNLLTRTK